jgi:hypothetical protein
VEILMLPPTLGDNGSPDDSAHVEHLETADEDSNQDHSNVVTTVATVAVVGIGAAVFEAALLPGFVLGVAAMWLPQYVPKMGEATYPLFTPAVRGIRTANAALDLVSLVSAVGQFGMRASRRSRSLSTRGPTSRLRRTR